MTKLQTLAFLQYLKDSGGYDNIRILPDGRWAASFRFAFTWAIITGTMGNRNTYDDRWCYHDESVMLAALEAWDGTGEPQGWHRHPLSGRRREDGVETIRM